MAKIHISEIQKHINNRDGKNVEPGILIYFDDPERSGDVIIDEEHRSILMPLECDCGSIVLAFDDYGMLEYLELV